MLFLYSVPKWMCTINIYRESEKNRTHLTIQVFKSSINYCVCIHNKFNCGVFDNLKDLFVFGWSVHLNAHSFHFLYTSSEHQRTTNKAKSIHKWTILLQRTWFALFFGTWYCPNEMIYEMIENNTHIHKPKQKSGLFSCSPDQSEEISPFKVFTMYHSHYGSVQGLRMASSFNMQFVPYFPSLILLPLNCQPIFIALFSRFAQTSLSFSQFLRIRNRTKSVQMCMFRCA